MKKLGSHLKKEREKQGLSLEDVASRTKIHIQKLIDIEEGHREALPAKVFCVGLIKSYARELKVDMAKVDQLCRAAFDEPTGEGDKPVPAPCSTPVTSTSEANEFESQPIGRFKVPKPVVIGATLLLCLALILVIFQVIEKVNSYSKEEELPQEVFSTSNNATQDTTKNPALEESIAEENQQETPEKLELATTESNLESNAPQNEKAETPKATEKVVALDEAPENTSGDDFSDDNFGGQDTADATKPNVSVSNNKLTITALEPVRAEVVWSDGYVQVMLLKSQETKTLVFSSPIMVRVNNGGAIQVSFNEGEKKVPGDFNKPIELKYP